MNNMKALQKKSYPSEVLSPQVWPGETVFPDYTSENCTEWWVDEYERFYKEVKHDALWIVRQYLKPSTKNVHKLIWCTPQKFQHWHYYKTLENNKEYNLTKTALYCYNDPSPGIGFLKTQSYEFVAEHTYPYSTKTKSSSHKDILAMLNWRMNVFKSK